MHSRKDSLKAVGIVVAIFLIGLALRVGKFDLAMSTNDPRLFIPVLAVIFVLMVGIAWRSFHNQ